MKHTAIISLHFAAALAGCSSKQSDTTKHFSGEWAFPVTSVGKPPPDDGRLLSVPDSTKRLTATEIHDRFVVADWFPQSHPPMPNAVIHGRKPDKFACGYCHLPNGEGRPENAALAGLPKDYFKEQVEAFANGTRQSAVPAHGPGANMQRVAKMATRAEVEVVAEYYASLPFKSNTVVREEATIPALKRAGYGMRVDPRGGHEPLGQRIIELADDEAALVKRDPRVTFTAFVPPGSLRRGEQLSLGRADPSHTCTLCHGRDLGGQGTIPGIAGKSPTYLFRQLVNFREGTRSTSAAAPMREVVSRLPDEDLIALAAWASSRPTMQPNETR